MLPPYFEVVGILLPDEETGELVFPEGCGTLFTLTFKAVAVGNVSTFRLDPFPTYQLFSAPPEPLGDLEEIPHELIEGYIEIREPMPWDLNIDSKIDVQDLAIAALAFGSFPSHPRWNPDADINKDGKIDMKDLATVTIHFGETYS